MIEEELLYAALASPLGLVVRADKQRLARARSKLLASDPALHELLVIGPDPGGQTYLLRADKARQVTNRNNSVPAAEAMIGKRVGSPDLAARSPNNECNSRDGGPIKDYAVEKRGIT